MNVKDKMISFYVLNVASKMRYNKFFKIQINIYIYIFRIYQPYLVLSDCELGISMENLNKGYNENDKSRVDVKYNPLLLFLHF